MAVVVVRESSCLTKTFRFAALLRTSILRVHVERDQRYDEVICISIFIEWLRDIVALATSTSYVIQVLAIVTMYVSNTTTH